MTGRRARHCLILTRHSTGGRRRRPAPDSGNGPSGLLRPRGHERLPDADLSVWAATGTLVLNDAIAPKLEDACLFNGQLEMAFSETPDMALAASRLLLDGQPATWTLAPDGYTLEYSGALAAGSHTLELLHGAFDLAGISLAGTEESTPISYTFELDAGASHVHVFGAALAGETTTLDAETGLLYVRHRYYDPEIGRFLQVDPYGYADAPNLYQYGLGDPINNSDPTGQYA